MKQTQELFELNPSQEVVLLQTKYTIFKRVINITMSATAEKPLNYQTMLKAFNLAVARNDCTRIRFVKKKGKLLQYFLPEVKFDSLPQIAFESPKDQENFIKAETHKAIKYKKGEVIKPFFIKTYDGKDMVLLKVCHLNFDLYGLNVFFKDLFEVYEALDLKKELPETPASFKEVIIRDLKQKNDAEYHEKNRQFFDEYLRARSQPYYAGLNGGNGKLDKKMDKAGKHTIKMFFVHNDTQGYMHDVPKDLSKQILDYCAQNRISPANYLFFAFNVVQAKLNGKYNLMPLELCNCRGTMLERKSAGTKVQSLACYTTIKPELEYESNLKEFCENQFLLYRHIGFSDTAFQIMSHKIYKSSLLGTFYSLCFSFIPMMVPSGVKFQIYSNGKCALPAYVAVVYDVATGDMKIVYDCQTKLMNGEDIKRFHEKLMQTLEVAIKVPQTQIKDI